MLLRRVAAAAGGAVAWTRALGAQTAYGEELPRPVMLVAPRRPRTAHPAPLPLADCLRIFRAFATWNQTVDIAVYIDMRDRSDVRCVERKREGEREK